jgi:hypothetical protein
VKPPPGHLGPSVDYHTAVTLLLIGVTVPEALSKEFSTLLYRRPRHPAALRRHLLAIPHQHPRSPPPLDLGLHLRRQINIERQILRRPDSRHLHHERCKVEGHTHFGA